MEVWESGIDHGEIAVPVGAAVEEVVQHEADRTDGDHEEGLAPGQRNGSGMTAGPG